MTHLQTVILEVQTDQGISGLGEFRGERLEDGQMVQLEQLLIGQDPRNISRLVPALEEGLGRGALSAGVDFALHDIKGKALGVPVYQLLGGKRRDAVPLVWTLPYLSIEEQVAQARERVQEGFTHVIKMKVGVPGDSEHILAVARAIGDVPLRPDSNMGHSKPEAIKQFLALRAEGVRYELIEDPCPLDLGDYQEVGDALDTPISLHGGWSDFDDLAAIIRAAKPAIKCVNIMITHWGLFRSAQIVGALEAAGIGWTLGTSHDSSIKIAAAFHLATAMPNKLYPCDLLGPRLHVADIAAEPLHIEAGYGKAPERPGLGVELNEDVMKQWGAGEAERQPIATQVD